MTSEAWLDLRELIVKGDVTAFEQLYNALWSRLYSTTYNYVRDTVSAQEIVQEVFIKLWLKRDDLKDVKDIHAFAIRAAQFRIYDFFDKQKVEIKYARHMLKHTEDRISNTHHLAEYNDALEVIEKEIKELPGTTQSVFRLSRFEQLSNEEIASKLRISIKTVEYHITQSLKHLKVRLRNLLFLTIILQTPYLS